MPTFEEARDIIESISTANETDRRDRALISFALITGIRISAISSLKMKCFDRKKKLIDQNPGDRVRTKNAKHILTTFFPIGWPRSNTFPLKVSIRKHFTPCGPKSKTFEHLQA